MVLQKKNFRRIAEKNPVFDIVSQTGVQFYNQLNSKSFLLFISITLVSLCKSVGNINGWLFKSKLMKL